MIRITDKKGFYFGFSNVCGVSVQIGPGNYCDNYDMSIGEDEELSGREGSNTAEIAVITPEGELFPHPDFEGDTVKGWIKPEDILQYMEYAKNLHIEEPKKSD